MFQACQGKHTQGLRCGRSLRRSKTSHHPSARPPTSANLQVWESVTGSKATDQTLIVLSGIAKVYVGDLIEAGVNHHVWAAPAMIRSMPRPADEHTGCGSCGGCC